MTVFQTALDTWAKASNKLGLDVNDKEWQEIAISIFTNVCNFNNKQLAHRSAVTVEKLWDKWSEKGYPNHLINTIVSVADSHHRINGSKRKPYFLECLNYSAFGTFDC